MSGLLLEDAGKGAGRFLGLSQEYPGIDGSTLQNAPTFRNMAILRSWYQARCG